MKKTKDAEAIQTAGLHGDLPDVNVWIALAAPSHPHHESARAYWQHANLPRLWFNRVTMLAMVRLLCQRNVMGDATCTLAQGIQTYRSYAALPEVGFMTEPEYCEPTLMQLVQEHDRAALPARLWTDLYLAAFAIASDLRLVTFDRDFTRFAGLKCLRLPISAD
jgi:uncharacterized protein